MNHPERDADGKQCNVTGKQQLGSEFEISVRAGPAICRRGIPKFSLCNGH